MFDLHLLDTSIKKKCNIKCPNKVHNLFLPFDLVMKITTLASVELHLGAGLITTRDRYCTNIFLLYIVSEHNVVPRKYLPASESSLCYETNNRPSSGKPS